MVSVNKKDNIILSSLSNSELQDFFQKANSTPLFMRRKLNLADYISFGNEIEINGLSLATTSMVVTLFNDVHNLEGNERFSAVKEDTAFAEVVTPVLTNRTAHWKLLGEMYDTLYETGATISGNTSSHLHFGTHKINTPEKLSLLLKTLVVFEPIIFKFGYGKDLGPRLFMTFRDEKVTFSPMMSPKRVRNFTDVLDYYSYASPGVMRSHFVDFLATDLRFRPVYNFNNFDFSKLQYSIESDIPSEYDHFEIRCFNGTLEPEVTQNNINLIGHIIMAVVEDRIDKDYVLEEYKKYKVKRYDFDVPFALFDSEKTGPQYNRLLNGFNKIKMDKALKLADMIFDTEIDKLYFVKQYLKLFETEPEYVRSLCK